MPLEKESLNNFLPDGFETNNLEGAKENFSADKIATGYEKDVKDRVSGPNFNNLLDVLGKNTNILTKFMDFIKNMPINNLFTVDENNQLVYKNLDEVGGSGLEVCDIGMALYVDETKGLRRYLNGQIVDINTNTQAFLNRLKEIQTTNPDYFTTEDNWQAEATLNLDGCVYKFVLNYADDGETVVSVRLPKYPDYVEIDSNSINSTAPVSVYGNGMILGLTDGTNNFGLSSGSGGPAIGAYQSQYGQMLPRTGSGNTTSGLGNYIGMGVTKDSTKSGLVGKATITSSLKQTKLKMRYFIQIATGSETENNIINDIELSNPFSLLDYKYSEYELNNLSWLRSNGQYNSKAVYPAVYDLLLKIYNGTETKAGVSVKLSTEAYTDYDFVLNTADETFRLPLKTKLASGKAVVGNGMALGLTNGTVNTGLKTNSGNFAGILSQTQTAYGQNVGTNNTSSGFASADTVFGVTTDPTKSGIETSDSGLYLYFYVGETVQNANLIDAGRIGEILPTKTDKVQAAQASMPSSKYIDLTLGATGSTYIAPANGWFALRKTSSASSRQYLSFWSDDMNVTNETYVTQATIGSILPCKKGQKVVIYYSLGGGTNMFRFYYAEGEV